MALLQRLSVTSQSASSTAEGWGLRQPRALAQEGAGVEHSCAHLQSLLCLRVLLPFVFTKVSSALEAPASI